MRNKANLANIDLSDPNYLYGRIKNNTGSDDGTPVNERVYGDVHQFFAKLISLAGITPNDLPDNELNGYQTIDALINLASKNDYLQTLGSVSGVLNIGVKIGLMQVNEILICKASSDFTTETTIKGIDNVINAISVNSNFKANDYLLLQKTASNIQITRLVDAVNLDIIVAEFNYLKKANQTQENAGTSEVVATTPKTNKTVFERRVNGVDSSNYIAKGTSDPDARNGLLSKEDKEIINNIGASPIKNKGFFSGLDVGGTTGSLTVGGNCVSATASVPDTYESAILVTMAVAMANTNYVVKTYVESLGPLSNDLEISNIVFKPISTTQFQLGLTEVGGGLVTSLKIHFEVEQK